MVFNPNNPNSLDFLRANGLLTPKKLPTVKPKAPSAKPKTYYGANDLGSGIFKKANAPDQVTARPQSKPAPKPTLGTGYPNFPAVTAAGNLATQIAQMAGGGGSYGSSPSTTASLLKQAQQMVGYELDPQIHAAQAATNQENRDYKWLVDQLTRQTSNAKGDIGALFGALDQQLAAGQQAQKASYAKAGTEIAGNYDQLSQMLDQGYTKAQNAATTEQQRLGIQGPGQNDRLSADKAYLSGLAQEQKANAVSNIQTQGETSGSIAASMRASSQEAPKHIVAAITVQANENQQTLLKQHMDNLSKFKSQIGLLNSQRAGKVQILLKQMEDQLYQRQQDAAQLQFMNSIRAGELGISAANLQLAQARLAQDGQNQTDRLVLEAKRLELEQQKAAGGPAPKTTGMENAFNYLASAYPNKSSDVQQSLQDALIDAINGNTNDAGYNPNDKSKYPGYDPKYLDIYLRDIDSAVNDRAKQGWGPAERSLLRNAALKFFGR